MIWAPRSRKCSTMARPSTPPSIGSVPAPTSSTRINAGRVSWRFISTMLAICPEKVLKLVAIDCSSPMSANTERNTGTREPGPVGMCSPDWAITTSSPAVFRATVFPPVLGPVTMITRVGGFIVRLIGTGSIGESGGVVLRSLSVTALIRSGCLAACRSSV